MFQRELTGAEKRALNLCKVFEKACDNHRLCVTLTATDDSLKMIYDLEKTPASIKTLRIQMSKEPDKYDVTFTMTEFRKYLDIVLIKTGLRLRMDGSLQTFDNLTISNEYLN